MIDQSNNLVHRSMSKITVWAPQAGVVSTDNTGEIAVPGDQRAFAEDVETVDGGSVDASKTEYKGSKTIYTIKGSSNRRNALRFGKFGETNKVLVK